MIQSFLSSWTLFYQSYLTGWLVCLLLSIIGVLVVARAGRCTRKDGVTKIMGRRVDGAERNPPLRSLVDSGRNSSGLHPPYDPACAEMG